jgi:hypothetical protein
MAHPLDSHIANWKDPPFGIGKSTVNEPFSIAMEQITRGFFLWSFQNIMKKSIDQPTIDPP